MRDGEIAAMRQDYTIGELLESSASPEPWELFSSWFEIARNTKILEPNAMILSTVTQDGQPTSRVVLLKDFDQSGLVFFAEGYVPQGISIPQAQYYNEEDFAGMGSSILGTEAGIYIGAPGVNMDSGDVYLLSWD